MESSVYLGFTDRAINHTKNFSSTAWVVYSPEGLLVSSQGVCLGPSTNNVAEYSVVIELLRNSISHGIRSLEVHLDSHLVVCHLNGRYCVCDPTLLRRFLQLRLLEGQFDFITYYHIPRSFNHVSNAYANFFLDICHIIKRKENHLNQCTHCKI
jgi:ribonuclease HI